MPMHSIAVRGQPLGAPGQPAICAPLVARSHDGLITEAGRVAALRPDLIEWRIDFFDGLVDVPRMLAAAHALRGAAGGIPILLTRRSQREGGEPIAISDDAVFDLYDTLARSGQVDMLDAEIASEPRHLARVRAVVQEFGLGLVLSFHDFHRTPAEAQLLDKFRAAHKLGATVAKVAVMPQRMEDVHALLGATLAASRELPIPVVSMAMGPMGAVTRVCGGVFGSALTFAVGAAASAPGQIPIADVRAALAVLAQAGGAKASG